jgi:hypothetical protein
MQGRHDAFDDAVHGPLVEAGQHVGDVVGDEQGCQRNALLGQALLKIVVQR